MTVMLKPHLWVNHNFYTGDLIDVEWKNGKPIMRNIFLTFAQLAQNENIELFCFGTELETLLQNALNTGHS
jgi:hypothetical protein